ncbi:hypothetical protein BRADI_4g42626v3, partial [Brachypodium distachyon]
WNLCHKTIISDDVCPRCNGHPETNAHLFYHCRASVVVWDLLGFNPPSPLAAPWLSPPRSAAASPMLWSAVVIIVLWKIWDARNSVVFRHVSLPPHVIVRNILADFTLWSHRLRKVDLRVAATAWRDYLSSRV